jgi:hypothetical protein
MKLALRFTFLMLIILCLIPTAQAKKSKHKPKPTKCSQGTAYRNCAACGTAKDNKHRTLNVQKNRGTAVTSPEKITAPRPVAADSTAYRLSLIGEPKA